MLANARRREQLAAHGPFTQSLRPEVLVSSREPAKSGELVVVPQTGDPEPMTAKERKALDACERTIEAAAQKATEGFLEMATAFHEIREQRLYRESSPTFATYFNQRWEFGRSHANRIADAGKMLSKMSPRGDILKLMTSEAHFRPLAKLDDAERNDTLALAEKWLSWRSRTAVPPALIRSAKAVLYPPEAPTPRDDRHDELIAEFLEMVSDTKAQLPDGTTRDIRKLFGQLQTKIEALRGPRSSTGIAWTEATWNPLQGCARVSAGCDRCYAAKLIATRMADLYPGLARVKVAKDGTKSYAFLNKIVLLPEDLGQPLHDLTSKRFFVNSMSDLFHKNVPDDFIAAVFDVMKKAHWHQFQVLTKRPERMADFTTQYFKDEEPPQNIWLGTSTENQDAFDERIPWLRKTKAAVRWLSCEPLLGPITFDSAKEIDWVVAGGESDSDRKMEKAWVVFASSHFTPLN